MEYSVKTPELHLLYVVAADNEDGGGCADLIARAATSPPPKILNKPPCVLGEAR